MSKKSIPSNPKFRSKFEKHVWDTMTRHKKKAEYEPFAIPYVIPASNHKYFPDLVLPNGVIVEIKGKLDVRTCAKMIAVKKSNPDLDIRFVFMNARNKMNKRSKTRYWEWAERHGFPWAEGTIPLDCWKE